MSCHEQHTTRKRPTDPTYSAEWSGVTYAPKCKHASCPDCGGCLHHEGHDSHYCPRCDDYKSAKNCPRF